MHATLFMNIEPVINISCTSSVIVRWQLDAIEIDDVLVRNCMNAELAMLHQQESVSIYEHMLVRNHYLCTRHANGSYKCISYTQIWQKQNVILHDCTRTSTWSRLGPPILMVDKHILRTIHQKAIRATFPALTRDIFLCKLHKLLFQFHLCVYMTRKYFDCAHRVVHGFPPLRARHDTLVGLHSV